MKVRQLEALIRLSEAITRCHPDDEVHPRHVCLATRLLKTSVISVESTEIDLTEFQDDIQEENQEDGDIGGNGESQPSGADAKLTNEYPENAKVAAKKLVITDEYFQRVTQALVMRLRPT